MPKTLSVSSYECHTCGVIVPFTNINLAKQKLYLVEFSVLSSVPNCEADIQPLSHTFVPTSDVSTLYASLRVSNCSERSATLVKLTIKDSNSMKEVYTDYTTVAAGLCPEDAALITRTPTPTLGATPTPTPSNTPQPTPTPSSLVAFKIEFSSHMIEVDCNSKDSIISVQLRGNINRRYTYEFMALNNQDMVSFGNASGQVFGSSNPVNISTNFRLLTGSVSAETLVKCRVKDTVSNYIGDAIAVIKCINN